jgi:hypothetical protein
LWQTLASKLLIESRTYCEWFQVWEFAEAYQRWQLLAELAEPNEKLEPVHHVSWAPNVGRSISCFQIFSSVFVRIPVKRISRFPYKKVAK